MRYAYPVEVLDEPDGITITCPDVPEMVTGGWGDLAANLEAAADGLATALSFYVEDGRPIPPASPAHGRPIVAVPALVAAKLALHDVHARRRGLQCGAGASPRVGEKAVRRLRDPLHRSHIDAVERALRALGRRLEVSDVAALRASHE